MVECGVVDIGGKSYACPLRSVSLLRSRMLVKMPIKFGSGLLTRSRGDPSE